MTPAPVLLNVISHQAKSTPDAVAMWLHDGEEITYAVFLRHIQTMAARLQHTVKPGDIVGLRVKDYYLEWVVLFAVARLGAASFDDAIFNAGKDTIATPAVKLTDGEPGEDPSGVPVEAVERRWLDEAAQSPAPRVLITPDTPARLVFTSGTTGASKGIMMTHGMLDARVPRYVVSFGMSEGSAPRAVSFIGLGAAPGFNIAMATWACGGTLLKYADKAELARQLTTVNLQFLMSSPALLREFVELLERDSRPVEGLRILVVGSVLQPVLARALAAKVTPDILIRYGATEASSVTSGPAAMHERDLGVAGYVLDGAAVEIVGETGEVLPPGEIGQIRTRAPGMAQSYFRIVQESKARFKDGWFYSGDLGHLSADGLLTVTGRMGGVLNVDGYKISPTVVENELMKLEGVADGGPCVLYNSAGAAILVIGVVLRAPTTAPSVEQALRKIFTRNLYVVPVGAIPRTAMGKLQQDLLAVRLASLSRGKLTIAPVKRAVKPIVRPRR